MWGKKARYCKSATEDAYDNKEGCIRHLIPVGLLQNRTEKRIGVAQVMATNEGWVTAKAIAPVRS